MICDFWRCKVFIGQSSIVPASDLYRYFMNILKFQSCFFIVNLWHRSLMFSVFTVRLSHVKTFKFSSKLKVTAASFVCGLLTGHQHHEAFIKTSPSVQCLRGKFCCLLPYEQHSDVIQSLLTLRLKSKI